VIEWILAPLHWSRSPDFTDRLSTCGRFRLTAKIRHGDPHIRWCVLDDWSPHPPSSFPSLRMAQEAVLRQLAQEATQ